MSEHFRIEGDLSFRCFVIQRTSGNSYQSEFYVPYKLWDEFVTFIKDIDTNRAAQGRGKNIFPKIKFQNAQRKDK